MFGSRRLLLATAVLAGVASMAGSSNAGTSQRSVARTALASYDGESLFRGLVLGTGPVARWFPEVNHPTSGAVAETQERLVTRIASSRPGYFDHFAATMRSGDPVAIRQSIIDTVAALANAARDEIRRVECGSGVSCPQLPPEVQEQLKTLVDTLSPVTKGVNDTAEALKSAALVATKTTAVAYSESVVAVITSYYVISWPFANLNVASPGAIAAAAGVAFESYVGHIASVL